MVLVEFVAVQVHPENAWQSAEFNKFVQAHAYVLGVTTVYVAVKAIRIAITIKTFIIS